jgi:hypothetical protein
MVHAVYKAKSGKVCMKYIELIKLRTAGNCSDEIVQILMETMDTNKKTDNCDIHFFKNTPVKTDFLVLIVYYADIIDPHGSRTGRELCESLNKFGLINHTIWTELYQN